MILYSLLIIVLMLARPQGLFTWSLPRDWLQRSKA